MCLLALSQRFGGGGGGGGGGAPGDETLHVCTSYMNSGYVYHCGIQ